MEDDSKINPANKGVKIYVQIPKAVAKALRKACADEEISRPTAIARALESWLSQGGHVKPGQVTNSDDSLERGLSSNIEKLVGRITDAQDELGIALKILQEARDAIRNTQVNSSDEEPTEDDSAIEPIADIQRETRAAIERTDRNFGGTGKGSKPGDGKGNKRAS